MSAADFLGRDINGNILQASKDGTSNYPLTGIGGGRVMGGLSNLNLGYLYDTRQWFIDHNLEFPYDVLNFHLYSNEYGGGHPSGLGQGLSTAISPEKFELRSQLEAITRVRDQYFTGKELWLSEFGYDTGVGSPNGVPEIGNNDREEVQGQWLVRSFLEISTTGFDRAVQYFFRDGNSNTPWLFETSGLLTDAQSGHQPKKSWYYVYSLKNILDGYRYKNPANYPGQTNYEQEGSLECGDKKPRIYVYKNGNPADDIYAIWSPTECAIEYEYEFFHEGLTLDSEVELISLEAPSIEGLSQDLPVESGLAGFFVTIPVSERPVFLKITGNVPPPIECVSNLEILPNSETCMSVTLNWNPWEPVDGGACEDRTYQI